MTPGPGVARTQLPKGFYAAGINCGVRKYRPDLGLIMSDVDAVAAVSTHRVPLKPLRFVGVRTSLRLPKVARLSPTLAKPMLPLVNKA